MAGADAVTPFALSLLVDALSAFLGRSGDVARTMPGAGRQACNCHSRPMLYLVFLNPAAAETCGRAIKLTGLLLYLSWHCSWLHVHVKCQRIVQLSRLGMVMPGTRYKACFMGPYCRADQQYMLV